MKIDLARRAEIGRERRTKTRANLMNAARELYAKRSLESVTVDDIVNKADVAKGTFYVHFEHLGELQSVIADELAQNFEDLSQPIRMSLADPLERVAAGCAAFIQEALRNPTWGSLLARYAWSLSSVGVSARANLREDLEQAVGQSRIGPITPQLSFDVVIGIVLQTMRSAGERRLSPADGEAAVAALLRAIGVPFDQASLLAARAFTRLVSDVPPRTNKRFRQAN